MGESLGLDCEDVRFSYGRNAALRGVTWRVGAGLTGILGPNGAGKTTLLSILATLLPARSGRVKILGNDPATAPGRRAIRRQLGYLPQAFEVARHATVVANVRYAAWVRGIDWADTRTAADAVIDLVGLADMRSKRAGQLSGGYRQRLGIACALVHRPTFILLDEPTVGLDPIHRVGIRQVLHRLAENAIVIVTTHMVEDLSLAGDRVAILSGGQIVFDGDVQGLQALGTSQEQEVESPLEAGYRAVLDGAGR
ncbi:MAG: ATP-binding cassette domain-containing protein [Bifidobacteriaceae bacterium]|nr:ATP-binding cassette domain-containing protein [Bifidobacteriaceae bacterium]